jgi:hypothetical protein
MTNVKIKTVSGLFAAAGLLMFSLVTARPAGAAGPTAQPPYSLSVFATSVPGPDGYTQPDSIVQWKNSILVGFQNHVAKDGTDGLSSTIVQYSLDGTVQRTFTVPGHNDGLRVVGEDHLWAVQNEDANPNLVVIDLESGEEKLYTFAPTVHQGGYDDIVVKNGQVYITASNPTVNGSGINVFPALVRATLHGDMVDVEPVLGGNDSAIDIPTGETVTLNLTDPDSLTIDPKGNIVLDSQGDSELVFIAHPGTGEQKVGRINITSGGAAITLDDTAFAPNGQTFLVFSDVAGDTVYRLDRPVFGFEPGTAYSASDTVGIIGVLDVDNGVVTPIATGFGSTRGMTFVITEKDRNDRDQDR